MAKSFKSFKGLNGEKSEFTVLLIHGRDEDWKQVEEFINTELRFNTKVLINDYQGTTIFQRLLATIHHDCDCAVAIMSGDDELRTNKPLNQEDETIKTYARQNVIYEMGYCLGFFDHLYWEDDDIAPVVILKEDVTNVPSDILGVQYLEYSNDKNGISDTYPMLQKALEKLYSQIKNYYKED